MGFGFSLRGIKKADTLRVSASNKLGGGRGIRTPGARKGTLVFKTSALNQLCHSSLYKVRFRSNAVANV